jgi:hypothetical protein
MAQFVPGKKFHSVTNVEVAVQEMLLPKTKSNFTRYSRKWLKNG